VDYIIIVTWVLVFSLIYIHFHLVLFILNIVFEFVHYNCDYMRTLQRHAVKRNFAEDEVTVIDGKYINHSDWINRTIAASKIAVIIERRETF